MKRIRLLVLVAALFQLGFLQAQDVHFSLYNYSPLSLNPALTGAFEGTARIGGVYRSQWYSVQPFETNSYYIDAPLPILRLRKNDWFGAGVSFVSDVSGRTRLKVNYAPMFSLSYHAAMNKDASSYLTLGLQGGMISRELNEQRLRLASGYDPARGTIVEGNIMDNAIQSMADNTFNFGFGMMFRSTLENDARLELGAGFSHLIRPDYSLLSGRQDEGKRPGRLSVHGRLWMPLNDKLSIMPTFLVQNTGGATEMAVQGWVGKPVNEKLTLNAGLGYRFADAAQVLFGVDYEDWHVALSYDLNLSKLSNTTNYQGAFEIAGYYILKVYKKPNVQPALLCPEF